MRYFTKEWYMDTQGDQEKVENTVRQYQSYLKSIKSNLPIDLAERIHMHDNRLLSADIVDSDLILQFDPSHALSNVTKIVFHNAKVTSDHLLSYNFFWEYHEIYITGNKFQLEVLFYMLLDEDKNLNEHLCETVIEFDDIQIFDDYFRNIGKCVVCGVVVSDPTKEKYESRVKKGTFFNGKWYCSNCRPDK